MAYNGKGHEYKGEQHRGVKGKEFFDIAIRMRYVMQSLLALKSMYLCSFITFAK